jgi:hypothetical protein
MNIEEIEELVNRKNFNLKTIKFMWNNKNKSGGNFSVNIKSTSERDYQIFGRYDSEGTIINLRFGIFLQYGCIIPANSIEEMFEFIHNVLEKEV